jgi:nucleotide-binding universal stress UspA family protein
VIAGHPVRDIVELAKELKVELLVIGATGHSALYERLIGSRADRIVQLAHCPVLVVKLNNVACRARSRPESVSVPLVWQ